MALPRQFRHRSAVYHIGEKPERPAPRVLRNLRRRRLRFVQVPAAQRNFRARFRQRLRHRPTQPLAAARHEGNLSVQPQCVKNRQETFSY